MSSTSENETEILLGNRHLLAIFFVLAVLLGIAFTGGYMVGRNSSDKRPVALTATNATDAAASTSTGAAETRALAPATDSGDQPATSASPTDDKTHSVQPAAETAPPPSREETPLGAPHAEQPPAEEARPVVAAAKPPTVTPPQPHVKNDNFNGPQGGQTYLQVAAVGHTEARALADVLSKKGFHAHAVAKPGSADIYRVLVGPMRDTSELSSTRDSLRNAGFTKIFVQRY